MGDFNVWGYLARMGVEVRAPGQTSLQEGDRVAGMDRPVILRMEDVEELLHVEYKQFNCQVPGCGLKFRQLHECETHYNAAHRHSCSVCKKALPSPHLLELHLQENHDSFFALLAERKPSYQCFLPTCLTLSWTPEDRHHHAIQVHKFPPDFRFDAIKKKERRKKPCPPSSTNSSSSSSTVSSTSIQGKPKSQSAQPAVRRPLSLARLGDTAAKRSSMISLSDTLQDLSQDSNSKQTWLSALDVSQTAGDSPSSLTGSGKKSRIPVLRSSSCRVPRNLSFGTGIQRTFVRTKHKHWHQNGEAMDTGVSIENVDLESLKNSLPN